jgi:hypothetical protein
VFNTIVFICKLILGLLPIAWGIAFLIYKKKHKCENLVGRLTLSIFGIGLVFCFIEAIDEIFYLLGW